MRKKGCTASYSHLSLADYQQTGLVFNGTHTEDGQELEVIFGAPEGHPIPDLEEEPQLNAPGMEEIEMQIFKDVAKKMGIKI
jgi:Mn-containing catalase